jgi:Lrp/AsnC family leucine-responsive transcriptional regulator
MIYRFSLLRRPPAAAQGALAAHMIESQLDEIDIRILHTLQSDARISNVELARRVHLSPSPCLTRVRALERAGVIQRYVSLVNPLAVGFGVNVFLQISLETQARGALNSFENALRDRPEVVECYAMTGDWDYLLRVVLPDIEALEKFLVNELSRIPRISRIKSSFALKQVKYETALPLLLPEHKPRTKPRRTRSGGL